MKKICYFGNFENLTIPTTDQQILSSLKKQADVEAFDIKKFDMKKLIDSANSSDFFLFHGSMPPLPDDAGKDITFLMMIERVRLILDTIKVPKVMWFLDRIWLEKAKSFFSLYAFVDLIFVHDETWLKRFESDKIFPLHIAASEEIPEGKFRKELACDVAFIGNVYTTRQEWFEFIKKRFGDNFKVFKEKYGQDFADIVKSAKIIISPEYPYDDFYWSDRIYEVLRQRGFLMHQRTYGLDNQGFKDGEHYISYQTQQDMLSSIINFSKKEADVFREEIGKRGKSFVEMNHTYGNRIRTIISKVEELKDGIQSQGEPEPAPVQE